MADRILLFVFFIGFFLPSLQSQSQLTEELFYHASDIFKGKVQTIRYVSSNAEGSDFDIQVSVEEYYKGDRPFKQVSFGKKKLDVIDLELDTMVLDYRFQIKSGNSYIFFVKNLRGTKNGPKTIGYAQFLGYYLEGIPAHSNLITFLQSLSVKNKKSDFNLHEKLLQNASKVVLGTVNDIVESLAGYSIDINTPQGPLTVHMKRPSCICQEGQLVLSKDYLFYLTENESGSWIPIDEWVGVIEAGEYDQVKYRK